MCGFVVWADFIGPINSRILEQVRDLLQHRGPDDSGLYVSHDAKIGLAFRRLSIIDLSSAGHQPMVNEDESLCIVFNGEIYNFREIRQELEYRGYQFHSETDTEVILYSYKEWGEVCVQKFIGMFSLVIWDRPNRKIFAARDRLGIKPLYYSVRSHDIMLASELKPIIRMPDFDNTLDVEALEQYFARGYVSSPKSIFQSVRSLEPGHFLVWHSDTGRLTLSQYWNPLDYFSVQKEAQQFTEQQWIEHLEALLRSSVKYRLISDVPLGVFLSGGLDSSLVTALMCQVSNSPVRTFTVGFNETKFDETFHAANVAQHLGTSHTRLQMTYEDARRAIPHLVEYYDEPFADSSQIPTLLVSKLARQHVTVALSGDGGDELFAGYETYRLMENWQLIWKLPKASRLAVGQMLECVPNERIKLAGRGLRLPDPVAFASYFTGIWRPHEVISLLRNITDSSTSGDGSLERYLGDKASQGNMIEKLMLVDLQRYLPNDILTKLDRASMAVSLEARVPLLDHRVVEFALGMPFSLKRRKGQSKYALRQILYRYVPATILERPKQGFSVPLDHWLKNELHGLVENYLDPGLLRRQGLFNLAAVKHQLGRFMSGQSGHSRIWSLLMFQMWAERYLGLE